jgi:hypothetical protein
VIPLAIEPTTFRVVVVREHEKSLGTRRRNISLFQSKSISVRIEVIFVIPVYFPYLEKLES